MADEPIGEPLPSELQRVTPDNPTLRIVVVNEGKERNENNGHPLRVEHVHIYGLDTRTINFGKKVFEGFMVRKGGIAGFTEEIRRIRGSLWRRFMIQYSLIGLAVWMLILTALFIHDYLSKSH